MNAIAPAKRYVTHRTNWREVQLGDLPADLVAEHDIVVVHGNGGFGAKVLKHRGGATGEFPTEHVTTVLARLS